MLIFEQLHRMMSNNIPIYMCFFLFKNTIIDIYPACRTTRTKGQTIATLPVAVHIVYQVLQRKVETWEWEW